MSDRKKRVKVMDGVAELLEKYLAEKLAAGEKPGKHGYRFDVYGTKNEGFLRLEPSASQPGKTMLHLGVYRQGTDRVWSNYLYTGEPRQVLEKLRDPASRTEWLEDLMSLSNSVDEYW